MSERAHRHIGRAPRRQRTQAFVAGRGRYVSDLEAADALAVCFHRSTEAHAQMIRIDATRARSVEGVIAVVTHEDVADLRSPPDLWQLQGQNESNLPALARDRVLFVGQPIAAVVAVDAATARRACEQIEVKYEPLSVVLSPQAARAADAPRVYPHWPDNVVVRRNWKKGDVSAALAQASIVIEECFSSGRVHPLSIEPRGVLVRPQADGGLEVWLSTQSVHQIREAVAVALSMPEHLVRVVAPDVGGSFGMKACAYAEELILAHTARRLERPLRWIETRREAFVASVHGRDEAVRVKAGFDDDGVMTALEAEVVLDKGAELYRTSIGTAWITGALLTGPYRVQVIDIEALGVVTNKTPTGAYRGFGQPEACFAMERAFDLAAGKLGLDPAEIRRRNLVREQEMPWPMPSGIVLDSGRYGELLDQVLDRFGWHASLPLTSSAWPAASPAPTRTFGNGKLRGRGLACYIEVTNFGPSNLTGAIGVAAGGFDLANVRMEPSGHVRLFTGQTPMGQGVEEALRQICAEELGVELEDVSVSHGDTLCCSYTAYASGGSRGAGVGGSAVALASRRLAERLRRLGAHVLGVDIESVELCNGAVGVRGDFIRHASLRELAKLAYRGAGLPEGAEPGLEERASFDPVSLAVSYGAVAVEVAVDPQTGLITVERIVFGHDCGRQINPALVEGQVIGGIVQGIGATLFESLRYDTRGRPLVDSMHDYPLPLASDVPHIELLHLETPTPFSITGAKGVGESGVIPIPAAIANAVADAIGSSAASNSLPIEPEHVLRALHRR